MEKYAVIYTDQVYHEGDERSRTHPGHGYSAYTETVEKIRTFKNLEELKTWIRSNSTGFNRKSFKAIQYQELQISMEVVVNVK